MGCKCYAVMFNGTIIEDTYTSDKRKAEKQIIEYINDDVKQIMRIENLVSLNVDMYVNIVEWNYMSKHDEIMELVKGINAYRIVEFESK